MNAKASTVTSQHKSVWFTYICPTQLWENMYILSLFLRVVIGWDLVPIEVVSQDRALPQNEQKYFYISNIYCNLIHRRRSVDGLRMWDKCMGICGSISHVTFYGSLWASWIGFRRDFQEIPFFNCSSSFWAWYNFQVILL